MNTIIEWTTTHDTANRTMTHDFGNGNQIFVDFNINRMYLTHNGDKKADYSISGMDTDYYLNILVNTAKSLQK